MTVFAPPGGETAGSNAPGAFLVTHLLKCVSFSGMEELNMRERVEII